MSEPARTNDPPPPPSTSYASTTTAARNGPVAMADVRVGDDGCLADDVPCRACGYNLHGLPMSGRCPECEAAVFRSLRGDLLRSCDPRWVERLARGVLLVIIAIIIAIVGSSLLFALSAAFGGMSTTPTTGGGATATAVSMGSSDFSRIAGVIVAGIVAVIAVIGVWLLTTPDPAAGEAARPVNARTLTRYCLLAELLASPLEAAWGGSGGFPTQLTAVSTIGGIMNAIVLIAGAVVIVGYAAGFTYLARLAMRIPNPGLARQSKIVMYGLVISRGVMFLAGGVLAILAAFSPGFPADGGNISPILLTIFAVLGLGICAAVPASLIFGIWAIVLLFLFRTALSTAAAEGRTTWAA